MKHKTITIGITAFNEEQNIKTLIQKVLGQTKKNFSIEEILVISDCSTDTTVQQIKSIKDDRIRIFNKNTRKGKAHRLNQLLAQAKSDILVLCDADILVNDNLVIYNLIRPMLKDPTIDLIYGYLKAVPPQTFIERLAYFGYEVWEDARNSIQNNANKYFSVGKIRASSVAYRNKFRYPDDLGFGEDTYSFYYALVNGFKVQYDKDAIVYIRLPSTLQDYAKYIARTKKHAKIMEKYFPLDIISVQESLTFGVMFRSFIKKSLHTNPVIVVSFVILHAYSRLFSLFYTPKKLWDITTSSKNPSLQTTHY